MDSKGRLLIRTSEDADALMARIRASASQLRDWVAGQAGDPLQILHRMKFELVGVHPVEGHSLNLIEQINQTWTFTVAVAAVRRLLCVHPEAGGFRLAPGAHASQPLDIMSEAEGLVGAETFAAVNPANNRKLATDLAKLAGRTEAHRYVFFMSPLYPREERQTGLERDGIQVWSVAV